MKPVKALLLMSFGIGYMLALSGAFEQALDNYRAGLSPSPIWSSVFGPPILHHYLTGFIIVIVAFSILIYLYTKKSKLVL